MHGNAVPVNILVREWRSHKCVSCKWERWCYSVPINILNSRSFSFTYGHVCCVRRDSPTWNMQQVQQLAFGCQQLLTNKTRPNKKRSKQCRYAIEVILIYFNTLIAIGATPIRFIKSGKFLTQPDTIQSNPWIDLTHDCL